MEPQNSRTVAIVGRPNVGKSALFNRLAGRKISIVHDQPGVTRDRIAANCRLGNKPFTVIDTGGIGGSVDLDFTEQVRIEVNIAIETADVLLFVVDAQEGITPIDQTLAKDLRKIKKPLILVVNKIDHDKHDNLVSEFSKFGFQNVVSMSAEHGRGTGRLVEQIEQFLPDIDLPELEKPVAITIVGRPNVGKSSLINAIVQGNRTLVSNISGTTRDAIDVSYTHDGKSYLLIDTAGIRPRGRHNTSVEVFSVMRSEKSIRRADISILVIDAMEGVTAQDKKIASLIQKAEKPCIVVINKFDLVKDSIDGKQELKAFLDNILSELFFVDYAPLVLLSAKTRENISRLFKIVEKVHRASKQRIGTGPLNRVFQTAFQLHPPPMKGSRRFKMLYATQLEKDASTETPPPAFMLFVNDAELLTDSYRKFLESKIREHSEFTGLPIIFRFKERETRKRK